MSGKGIKVFKRLYDFVDSEEGNVVGFSNLPFIMLSVKEMSMTFSLSCLDKNSIELIST